MVSGSLRPVSTAIEISVTIWGGVVGTRTVIGKQGEIGVGEFDAHTRRARLAVDLRIDHTDLSGKYAPRKTARPYGHGLSDPHRTEVSLGDIDKGPHHGGVGDAE